MPPTLPCPPPFRLPPRPPARPPARSLTKQDGFVYMGIMTLVLTLPLFGIMFPMWGSMLTGPTEGATEEEFYLKEWSAEEVSEGLHHSSMRFAMESRSQRGYKDRLATSAMDSGMPTVTLNKA